MKKAGQTVVKPYIYCIHFISKYTTYIIPTTKMKFLSHCVIQYRGRLILSFTKIYTYEILPISLNISKKKFRIIWQKIYIIRKLELPILKHKIPKNIFQTYFEQICKVQTKLTKLNWSSILFII